MNRNARKAREEAMNEAREKLGLPPLSAETRIEPSPRSLDTVASDLTTLAANPTEGAHTAKVILESRKLARSASNIGAGRPEYAAHMIVAIEACIFVGSYPDARDIIEMAEKIPNLSDEHASAIATHKESVSKILEERLAASQAIHGKWDPNAEPAEPIP